MKLLIVYQNKIIQGKYKYKIKTGSSYQKKHGLYAMYEQ